MAVATATKVEEQAKWQVSAPKEKLFSEDNVIDAYLKGKREGLKAAEKASWELLNSNIEKSAEYTDRVIKEITNKKFTPISAHLKICSLIGLNVIIKIKEEDFLSDEFLNIYSFIGRYENEINKDIFNLSFSFIDGDKTFNQTRLRADGFFLNYNSLHNAKSPRKTQ